MKHLFPTYGRTLSYVVLLSSIFLPMFLFLLGTIDKETFYILNRWGKAVMLLSLFVVFFSRQTKEEISEHRLRKSALMWGIIAGIFFYLLLLLIRSLGNEAFLSNLTLGWILLISWVLCLEFFCQKALIEKRMRERK